MAELSLEPFAARLAWRLAIPQPLAAWQDLMAALLDGLGAACPADQGHVIGHIKALALLPGGGFLRGSKVSATYPADIEAHDGGSTSLGGSFAAEAASKNDEPCEVMAQIDFAELEMTLNLLVYGLPYDRARRIVSDTGHTLAARWGAKLEILSAVGGPEA